MKLANAWIINHKSLKNVHLPLIGDSYTTLIGLNDAGKTTILQSLHKFFDEKATIAKATETSQIKSISNSPLKETDFKAIFTDLSLPVPEYSDQSVYILVEFKIEHIYTTDEVDELGPSDHLQWSIRNMTVDDSLYLLKVFGPKGDDYYVICSDAKDENSQPLQLWSQTQANLKSLQAKLGIKDSDIENKNGKGALKNIERADAIYAKKILEPMWARFDYKKDKSFFPVFRYLDWSISAEQIEELVATALGPVINESLKELQATVNTARTNINTDANTKLEELYEKYAKHLPVSITGLRANVDVGVSKRVTELFVEKSTSDSQIHVSDQGEGIKRQIGLGLIRAIAEESVESGATETKYIWVFDEPETHLYPQAQRELAVDLQQLNSANFQIVISTHSITFVDKARLKNVYKTELEDGYTSILSTQDADDALTTLGVKNSDFLFYDKFIAVEGPTEYHLLDYLHKVIYGNTLTDVGVRVINLGGKSNMVHYRRILEEIIGDYRKPSDAIIYLLDKDTGVTGAGIYLIGDTADFEDSISNDIWIRLLSGECGVQITSAEIDAFRSCIDITLKGTKLHEKLRGYVANDSSRTQYLDSKGESLATSLKKYITNAAQIPQPFKNAFEELHKEA